MKQEDLMGISKSSRVLRERTTSPSRLEEFVLQQLRNRQTLLFVVFETFLHRIDSSQADWDAHGRGVYLGTARCQFGHRDVRILDDVILIGNVSQPSHWAAANVRKRGLAVDHLIQDAAQGPDVTRVRKLRVSGHAFFANESVPCAPLDRSFAKWPLVTCSL